MNTRKIITHSSNTLYGKKVRSKSNAGLVRQIRGKKVQTCIKQKVASSYAFLSNELGTGAGALIFHKLELEPEPH
jgi:hypothetical protein